MGRCLLILLLITTFRISAKVDTIFEGETNMDNPFELRDPFQAPKFKSESNRKSKQRAKGILNNIKEVDWEFDLEKVSIVGVLIGKERRVILQIDGNKNTFTLKEGEEFGINGPEIKAILPGGVILVEKITNIYGEDEFIETIVPISK